MSTAMIAPASPRYTGVARLLHWVTALGIVAVAILGTWIGFFDPKPDAFKYRLYNIHESIGITLLVITLIRLAWRVGHAPPPITPALPVPLALVAHATHYGIYALLIAMPVVGFLGTNAWGFPLSWFGLIPLPDPIGRHETLAPLFSTLHFWMALALGALLCAHVGGALFHHLIRKDDTLKRMI